jgi:hypothetical protein
MNQIRDVLRLSSVELYLQDLLFSRADEQTSADPDATAS